MVRDEPGAGPSQRFSEDLIGLDPNDPEARAFAAHLDRMERSGPGYTVEASLAGVADFAESTNRIGGPRKHLAWLIATLILLGVLLGAWDTLQAALTWLGD